MKFHQREIVWTNFMFSNGESKPHFGLIVSSDELHEQTGEYYLVLLSSKCYHEEYCYELDEDMLSNFTFDKRTFVVCHLLTGYRCPSLQIIAAGHSEAESKREMEQMLLEHFEWCVEKGTLLRQSFVIFG